MSGPLLAISDFSVDLPTEDGTAAILDRISLDLAKGRILGVVGESGCGKSTLVRSILGLLPRNAHYSGEIRFNGVNVAGAAESTMQRLRGRSIGLVPQDPFGAWNPVFTIGAQVLEIVGEHLPGTRADHRAHIRGLLGRLGIAEGEAILARYPHELSGGQRQRLLLATALACKPDLLLADEPTSALDVTTQKEFLALLRQVTTDFQLGTLFVSHDFGVVSEICDRVVVLYAGQVVESGPTDAILSAPRHPYTRMLLACHPDRATSLAGIPGSVASPLAPPTGCRFHPRCPERQPNCSAKRPGPVVLEAQHSVSCVLYQ